MLWLLILAYNEKKNLVRFLPELHDFLRNSVPDYRILIINDGSTDSTAELEDRFGSLLPIKIISHEKNMGVGEAFKTALGRLAQAASGADLAIVMEGDGTSDYRLIPDMVSRLNKGNDIVIASRYIRGGGYRNFPPLRHLTSLVGNFILRSAFPNKGITDYTIFFRGYRVELIKKALSVYGERFITSDTFLANTEILIHLTGLTSNINEVPFVYAYEKKMGKSKMPLIKTLFDHLRFIAAQKLSRRSTSP